MAAGRDFMPSQSAGCNHSRDCFVALEVSQFARMATFKAGNCSFYYTDTERDGIYLYECRFPVFTSGATLNGLK